jgi:hypothetical protein
VTKSISSPEQLYVVVDQLDSDQNLEFSQRLKLGTRSDTVSANISVPTKKNVYTDSSMLNP